MFASAVHIAAGGIEPDDLSGLQLWFKADGTLWQEAARSTPAVGDGDPVGAWDDASGNNRHATQGTGGKIPTLQTAELNSLPVVRFDGGDALVTAAVDVVGADGTWTVFAVAAITGGSTPANIVDQDDEGSARIAQYLRFENAGATSAIAFNTGPAAFVDGSGQTVSGFDVHAGRRTTTTVEAFLNATSDGTTATTGTPKSGTSDPVTVGAYNSGTGQFLTGDIAEVIFYNRALTDPEMAQIASYLTTKYGAL